MRLGGRACGPVLGSDVGCYPKGCRIPSSGAHGENLWYKDSGAYWPSSERRINLVTFFSISPTSYYLDAGRHVTDMAEVLFKVSIGNVCINGTGHVFGQIVHPVAVEYIFPVGVLREGAFSIHKSINI